MKNTGALWGRFVFAILMAVFCSGCSEDSLPGKGRGAVQLSIVAGSEAKHIEHIMQKCARRNDIALKMHYSGSVDMMLSMKQADFAFDAVLPASSIWLRLGDQQFHRVKEEASIMRSPVGLGVKKPIAESLGWIGKEVKVSDILEAVQSNKFRFAMTSATQSNSGFSSYIGMLMALAGNPEVLTGTDLDRPELRTSIRNLLGGVNRGSGSSGWLMQTFVKDYDRLDAMFNYESMMIAANQELVRNGKEPLYIIYPVDGLAVADSTLAFINKPDMPDNDAKKEAFIRLRDCLLSDPVQNQILETGFRAGLIGMNPESAPKDIYNPEWGIDLNRTISPIVWPDADVTFKAMNLYQTAFRKPSLTVFAVDCSGSMKGQGLNDLKYALTNLFNPERASQYLIQTGREDLTVVIPFDNGFLWNRPLVIRGNNPTELQQLTEKINALQTRGGTNIYNPIAAAWQLFMSLEDQIFNYLPSVVLMTDGRSREGNLNELMNYWQSSRARFDLPPVFCIMYGKADDTQLREIANATYGKVFDGRHGGLDKAFRQAKGYN